MDNLHKKAEGFRNKIRREQIQTYKKQRRKELVQQLDIADQNDQSMHQMYAGVLRNNCPQILMTMSKEILESHLQMLNEIILSNYNRPYVQYFQKILISFVDLFQKAEDNCSTLTQSILADNSIQFNEDTHENIRQTLIMTKIFEFIQANSLNKLFAGIYYEINSDNNLLYLQKVIKILLKQLRFAFKDTFTIKSLLQCINDPSEYQLNKNINKSYILQVFMNISFSQNQEVIELLMKYKVYEIIGEFVESYGMSIEEMEVLSGIFSNSIEYICVSENQKELEQSSSHNVYYNTCLPLFEAMIYLQNKVILERMVHVGYHLLKTQPGSKKYIIELVEHLIRQLIKNKEYVEQSEKLFILLMSQLETPQFTLWIDEFLTIILSNSVAVYYGQNKVKTGRNGEKSKVLRNLKQIINACTTIISKGSQVNIQFQKSIVTGLIDFWCKQDLIMGASQLICFLKTSIQNNDKLSTFIIFEEYSEELLGLLNQSYQSPAQIWQHLSLISLVCERIMQSSKEQQQKHILKQIQQWENIQCYVQGYNNQFIEGSLSQYSMEILSKVQRLLKQSDFN